MATKKKLNTIITICGLSVVGIMFYRAWSTGNDFFLVTRLIAYFQTVDRKLN